MGQNLNVLEMEEHLLQIEIIMQNMANILTNDDIKNGKKVELMTDFLLQYAKATNRVL